MNAAAAVGSDWGLAGASETVGARVGGSRQGRNAAVSTFVVTLCYFVALLLFVIIAYRSFPIPLWIFALVVAATVVAVVSLGLRIATKKQRALSSRVRKECPGAVLIEAEWNAAMLPQLVKDSRVLEGADPGGFNVELAADAAGVKLWRGSPGGIVQLGAVAWDQVHDLHSGHADAVVGPKRVGTIAMSIDDSTTLSESIELIVRHRATSDVIAELNAVRRGRQPAPPVT